MSNLERNWLIRTSQNQILGPIAKAKLIEFIQKGALGTMDELSSGNGYWFHLREKDLVEKYIFGDVPQSYNPISEAKTVLARKANPDKTSSINASPANVTQIISLKDLNLNSTLPKNEDLEYPDITLVSKSSAPIENVASDGSKLPTSDDLEFPDITVVQTSASKVELAPTSISHGSSKPKEEVKDVHTGGMATDETKLPNQSDLEYPDMDFISAVKEKAEEEIEVKFEVKLDQPVEKKEPSISKETPKEKTDANLSLELDDRPAMKLELESKSTKPANKENANKESQKMLHERKTRAATAKRDESFNKKPDNRVPNPPRELAPELKNRNDSYLFIILIVLVLLIIGIVFYYYRFILNKPLPV